MKLYITPNSPYARLARILVIEKGLQHRVDITEVKTRAVGSPYYQVNPSGRVPYLVTDDGLGMEDSQLICAYLDSVDGKPRFHQPSHDGDWEHRRLEASSRSLCDGIAVWMREIRRPESERSPTVLAHEAARMQRLADFFEAQMDNPALQGAPRMAHFILTVALDVARKSGAGDLAQGRPKLAAWWERMAAVPSVRATALP